MQQRTSAPTIVPTPIHFHPDGPKGRSSSPLPREIIAQTMKNDPVKRQCTRPHREALSRQAVPMIVSDVGHKIIFNQAGAPKPSAKATHGTHQRRNPLSPRHNKSRSAPEELDALLLI